MEADYHGNQPRDQRVGTFGVSSLHTPAPDPHSDCQAEGEGLEN